MSRKKIVLIGAGSAVFTQGLAADFILNEDFHGWEIALVDIDPVVLQRIAVIVRRMVEKRGVDISVSASMDRKDVLSGADVVVATVAVGGRRAWENDVIIPRKYGIYQPVGDTSMPGGISRALRMIPAMLDIAADVGRLCPNAHFFNYSNPMTAICTAIRRQLDVPVVGLCHGVNHVHHYLARFIGKAPSEVTSLAVGLNHLTFLYDFRWNGANAWPLVDEKLKQQKNDGERHNLNETVFTEFGSEPAGREPSYVYNPFCWSLYETYGAFPAVLDRHVTEFFPERFPGGSYYGRTLGVNAFSFEGTIARGDEAFEDMKKIADGTKDLNERLFRRASGEHEQLVDILRSLYTDQRMLFSVNLPNDGAVPNLPAGAVLEMPAVATANGFYPLHITDFPSLPAAILNRRIQVVELTVEAALTGKKSLVVEAILADGATALPDVAERLAEELLAIHKPYLPQFS